MSLEITYSPFKLEKNLFNLLFVFSFLTFSQTNDAIFFIHPPFILYLSAMFSLSIRHVFSIYPPCFLYISAKFSLTIHCVFSIYPPCFLYLSTMFSLSIRNIFSIYPPCFLFLSPCFKKSLWQIHAYIKLVKKSFKYFSKIIWQSRQTKVNCKRLKYLIFSIISPLIKKILSKTKFFDILIFYRINLISSYFFGKSKLDELRVHKVVSLISHECDLLLLSSLQCNIVESTF